MMKLPFALGPALGAAVLLAGCGVPPESTLPTATVKKGDLIQTVTATGTTVAANQAKLSFKIPGRIARINVGPGDQVAAGQVLAEIDPGDVQAALQQAQAAKQSADAGIATAQAKVQQLLASAKPETIAQAKAAADAARQKLQLAENGARPEQLAQAQAGLQLAQAKLQALKDGPRPEQLAVLQRQVDVAKNNLYAVLAAPACLPPSRLPQSSSPITT